MQQLLQVEEEKGNQKVEKAKNEEKEEKIKPKKEVNLKNKQY